MSGLPTKVEWLAKCAVMDILRGPKHGETQNLEKLVEVLRQFNPSQILLLVEVFKKLGNPYRNLSSVQAKEEATLLFGKISLMVKNPPLYLQNNPNFSKEVMRFCQQVEVSATKFEMASQEPMDVNQGSYRSF